MKIDKVMAIPHNFQIRPEQSVPSEEERGIKGISIFALVSLNFPALVNKENMQKSTILIYTSTFQQCKWYTTKNIVQRLNSILYTTVLHRKIIINRTTLLNIGQSIRGKISLNLNEPTSNTSIWFSKKGAFN